MLGYFLTEYFLEPEYFWFLLGHGLPLLYAAGLDSVVDQSV